MFLNRFFGISLPSDVLQCSTESKCLHINLICQTFCCIVQPCCLCLCLCLVGLFLIYYHYAWRIKLNAPWKSPPKFGNLTRDWKRGVTFSNWWGKMFTTDRWRHGVAICSVIPHCKNQRPAHFMTPAKLAYLLTYSLLCETVTAISDAIYCRKDSVFPEVSDYSLDRTSPNSLCLSLSLSL